MQTMFDTATDWETRLSAMDSRPHYWREPWAYYSWDAKRRLHDFAELSITLDRPDLFVEALPVLVTYDHSPSSDHGSHYREPTPASIENVRAWYRRGHKGYRPVELTARELDRVLEQLWSELDGGY